MRTRKVCSRCHSTEVRHDAWAEWDEDSQEWVLSELFDYAYCLDCDGETGIHDESLPDNPTE